MRDLYLPGGGPSRMTARRLWVLIKALPDQSLTKTAARADFAKAKAASKEQKLRDRQARYAASG